MKKYYQSELNNLDNVTIEAIEDYTRDNYSDKFFYKVVKEFDDQRDEEDKIFYLENLAIDLNLKKFNLTDIQEIIVAYMFVDDIFSKDYSDEIVEILEQVL